METGVIAKRIGQGMQLFLERLGVNELNTQGSSSIAQFHLLPSSAPSLTLPYPYSPPLVDIQWYSRSEHRPLYFCHRYTKSNRDPVFKQDSKLNKSTIADLKWSPPTEFWHNFAEYMSLQGILFRNFWGDCVWFRLISLQLTYNRQIDEMC